MPIARTFLLILCIAPAAFSATIARQLVRDTATSPNLLSPDAWRPMGESRPVPAGSLACDNADDPRAIRGFSQTITLNQTTPTRILATALAKSTNVGGSRDPDYSLYLDILYTDNTPLWGQSAAFKTGSHDWHPARVVVIPAKPIKSVTVHLLFRRHTGRAEFKDIRLAQLDPRAGSSPFDGLEVLPTSPPAQRFLLRDVAADSDYIAFESGKALDIDLATRSTSRPEGTFLSARLSTSAKKDRALTLLYTVPVPSGNIQWLASPRSSLSAKAPAEYLVAARTAAGTGLLSRYPFAAVASPSAGHAIALDMAQPAVFRVGYSAGARELYIAFDLALTPEKPAADLSFALFKFNPADGFRGAVDACYRAFPDFFRVRIPRQGIWMPFGKISKVPGWEDFGFRIKEGNDETAWDDAHDILTFRYTEPMTWWMALPKGAPRTLAAAEAHAKALADKGDAHAKALFASGMRDEAGHLVGLIRNEPWCDGVVWSTNSSPGLPGETDFRTKWNPALRDRLYGPSRRGDLDGEYVDSSEGYVTAELDFHRPHFAHARTPLTFCADTHAPALFRGLIAYEYIRALADDLHPAGKLTMANATPHNLCWLAPYLDVLGTETNWRYGNRWQPMSDDELMYRRILSAGKPYCFLMNTDFTRWTRDDTENFMRICLAYGMFPGFFSANASTDTYFSQSALYDRDRPLFKQYLPLCRKAAEAGWRPLPRATSSLPSVYVERFGDRLLTLFNDSPTPQTVRITPADPPAPWRDLLSSRLLPAPAPHLELTLPPHHATLLERQSP